MRCERCVRELERLRRARDRVRSILLPSWERADLDLDRAARTYRKGRHVCANAKPEEER